MVQIEVGHQDDVRLEPFEVLQGREANALSGTTRVLGEFQATEGVDPRKAGVLESPGRENDHSVCGANTTADAVAPALDALVDPFTLALNRAEESANDILDRILSEGDKPLIKQVDLKLKNREIGDEKDVEALVGEIRARLVDELEGGVRIRLV